MDLTFIAIIILLFIAALGRPIVAHHCAMVFNGKITATAMGVWMLLGSLAMYPLFGHLLADALPTLVAKPWVIPLAITKGLLLWVIIAVEQQLRQQSQSSSEYYKFVSLGILAVVNTFLGETLGNVQLASIGFLAFLGLAFVLRGHLSGLGNTYKVMFAILVLTGSTPGMFDQAVIGTTNWYVQLIFSALGITLGSFITKHQEKHYWKDVFTHKVLVGTGLFFLVTETIILYLLITHIPVTIASLIMRLSIPIIMVSSAISYREGSWKTQAIFGLLAYAAVLPIILF